MLRNLSMPREVDTKHVLAARSGDTNAFGLLVERHYRTVYGLAYSAVGDWSAAEDIAQETFLAAWANLSKLRAPGAFPMWIRKIARNLAKNWFRSEEYRQRLAEKERGREKDLDVIPSSSLEELSNKERQAEIWEALRSLSPKVREAMVLFYFEENSVTQAAASLGISESAAKQRLRQGRNKLREYFESKWEAEVKQIGKELSSANARDRILASLVVGPAVPIIGQAASGAGLGLWLHHFLHEGVPALKSAWIGGTAMKTTTVAALIAALIGGTIYFTIQTEKESTSPIPSEDRLNSMNLAESRTVDDDSTSLSTSATNKLPPGDFQSATTESARDQSLTLAELLHQVGEEQEATSQAKELERGEIADPAQNCSISGSVLDEEGNPIPNAQITVNARGFQGPEEVQEDPDGYWKSGYQRNHHFFATSGRNGQYEVTGISFSGWRNTVGAFAPGFAPGGSVVALEPGSALEDVDITLPKGFTFKGRIVTVDGMPVPNAIVDTLGFATENMAMAGSTGVISYTDANGLFQRGYTEPVQAVFFVKTPTGEEFTFHDVPIGEDEVIELRLPALATIKGQITRSDGTPAEGVVVSLRESVVVKSYGERGGGMGSFDRPYTTTTVGTQGDFEIRCGPGESYSIALKTADRMPLAPAEELAPIAPGETKEWNYVIQDAMTVRGHVYAKRSGRPLKNILVSCLQDGEPVLPQDIRVNDDGSYELRIRGVKGTCLIFPKFMAKGSHPPGASPQDYGMQIELVPGEEKELDLTFLEPVTMSVQVVDPDNNPVEYAQIQCMYRLSGPMGGGGGGYPVGERTDKDGRFSWSGFAPGMENQIMVAKHGFIENRTEPIIGEPGQVLPEETIVLYESSGIEGIALDADGDPLANTALMVTVYYDEEKSNFVFPPPSTDENGKFVIDNGVPATIVTLEIKTMGSGPSGTSSMGGGFGSGGSGFGGGGGFGFGGNGEVFEWSSEPIECEPGMITDLGELTFSPTDPEEVASGMATWKS